MCRFHRIAALRFTRSKSATQHRRPKRVEAISRIDGRSISSLGEPKDNSSFESQSQELRGRRGSIRRNIHPQLFKEIRDEYRTLYP
jgi:hypothetical protein